MSTAFSGIVFIICPLSLAVTSWLTGLGFVKGQPCPRPSGGRQGRLCDQYDCGFPGTFFVYMGRRNVKHLPSVPLIIAKNLPFIFFN